MLASMGSAEEMSPWADPFDHIYYQCFTTGVQSRGLSLHVFVDFRVKNERLGQEGGAGFLYAETAGRISAAQRA